MPRSLAISRMDFTGVLSASTPIAALNVFTPQLNAVPAAPLSVSRWVAEWVKLGEEETRQLLSRGDQITEMGAEQRTKANKALADTLFQLGLQYNAKDVGELREFGKAKGLY